MLKSYGSPNNLGVCRFVNQNSVNVVSITQDGQGYYTVFYTDKKPILNMAIGDNLTFTEGEDNLKFEAANAKTAVNNNR